MEETKIVDTEILEGTPEELVTEVAIQEGGLSVGKVMLSMAIIGGIAFGAVKLYKFIKKRKAEKQMADFEECYEDQYEDEPQDETEINPTEA